MNVVIGLHLYSEPERLRATLASLEAHTPQPHRLILLPDGSDAPTKAYLQTLELPQLPTDTPQGAPACFNRLTRETTEDVLVLLESGSVVGPGWLEHLLSALEAHPQNGLAGPSTNRSWNEQGAFLQAGGSADAVVQTALEAQQRLGAEVRTLEPLYSLADFCYAVKREVIEAVGAADEGYGLGPCWEMDYNIRAARAGWRGVWATAAYVWRAPHTPRRQREEARWFEVNKKRYQDKFCGLRLKGQKHGYEPHCRGDACEHFAPSQLIQIKLPFPTDQQPEPSTSPIAIGELPLVSCLMPTHNRPEYVLQSIRYFERQDYPNKELLILDDGETGLEALLPKDPQIRYLRTPRLSIGAKRNLGCREARGSFMAQWDDDDWYGPQRLSAQLQPLLAGTADISALQADLFFHLPSWAFWRCTPGLHRRLFVEDVHGGTLVFRREVWQGKPYPDLSLAEDALFLRQGVRGGARLHRQSGQGLYIYLRHAKNSWGFECGSYIDPKGWLRVEEPLWLGADRSFYTARSDAAPLPLVSCIMPTYNRRPFVPLAIEQFFEQDYPHKELIVVDDGNDSVADLIPSDERVRYHRLEHRHRIGAKRNKACELAQGEIILHWDDDDWHAPGRIRYQVGELLESAAEVCGLTTLLFYHPVLNQGWKYTYPSHQRFWLGGSSLCYHKRYWARHRFSEVDVGEDARFVWAGDPKQMHVHTDPSFHIGLIHEQNISPKRTQGSWWQRLEVGELSQSPAFRSNKVSPHLTELIS